MPIHHFSTCPKNIVLKPEARCNEQIENTWKWCVPRRLSSRVLFPSYFYLYVATNEADRGLYCSQVSGNLGLNKILSNLKTWGQIWGHFGLGIKRHPGANKNRHGSSEKIVWWLVVLHEFRGRRLALLSTSRWRSSSLGGLVEAITFNVTFPWELTHSR